MDNLRTRKNRLYNIFNGMKQRCYNPKNERYERYGGRGIVMCDEWLSDSLAFMKWAYNNGYRDDLTIDRIDVNGNYEPKNCRWITTKEQMNNTSRNVKITRNGVTKTLKEWCLELGINPKTVDKRRRLGWKEEDYFKPVKNTKGENNGNAKLKDNEVLEIKELLQQGMKGVEIAKKYNVSKHLISKIKTGKMHL